MSRDTAQRVIDCGVAERDHFLHVGHALPILAFAVTLVVPSLALADAASDAEKQCGPFPYSVEWQVTGGEIAAKFRAGALAGLRSLPAIEGRAGGEIVRTAYAGMANQAMEVVLVQYGCRIKAYMVLSGTPDAELKGFVVDRAVALLSGEMGSIQNAALKPTGDDLTKFKVQYAKMMKREPDEPTLDSAILLGALKRYNPNTLFISQTSAQIWGSVEVGSALAVTACGGVVRAAISDGTSALQSSLARVQSILSNYLNSSVPPYASLLSLYNTLAVVPGTDATAAKFSFKDCSKEMVMEPTVIPPAAAASAPAVPASAAKTN